MFLIAARNTYHLSEENAIYVIGGLELGHFRCQSPQLHLVVRSRARTQRGRFLIPNPTNFFQWWMIHAYLVPRRHILVRLVPKLSIEVVALTPMNNAQYRSGNLNSKL
jgi:hypothetical protein